MTRIYGLQLYEFIEAKTRYYSSLHPLQSAWQAPVLFAEWVSRWAEVCMECWPVSMVWKPPKSAMHPSFPNIRKNRWSLTSLKWESSFSSLDWEWSYTVGPSKKSSSGLRREVCIAQKGPSHWPCSLRRRNVSEPGAMWDWVFITQMLA